MCVARFASSVCLVLGAFLHCHCIWHERCRGRTDTRVHAVSGSTVNANATYHCALFSPQVIFNRSRYKAALALMEKPIDADLLTRWVHHLKVGQQQQQQQQQCTTPDNPRKALTHSSQCSQGTEEPPKHSLARAETEHFRSLRKNASHKSKRGRGWKGGTQAGISEQVATEVSLAKQRPLNIAPRSRLLRQQDDGGSQSGPRVSGTAPSEPADTLPNQLNGDSV